MLHGEEIMIVGRTMLAQSTSDRRTDRQRFTTTKTALCTASRGKNGWNKPQRSQKVMGNDMKL